MLNLKSSPKSHLSQDEFMQQLKAFGAKKLDKDLIDLYMKQFFLVKGRQVPLVDIHAMADHYLARHPTEIPEN